MRFQDSSQWQVQGRVVEVERDPVAEKMGVSSAETESEEKEGLQSAAKAGEMMSLCNGSFYGVNTRAFSMRASKSLYQDEIHHLEAVTRSELNMVVVFSVERFSHDAFRSLSLAPSGQPLFPAVVNKPFRKAHPALSIP